MEPRRRQERQDAAKHRIIDPGPSPRPWQEPSPKPQPNPRKTAPHRGAGSAFVPVRPPGRAARSAQMPTGLPRGARCGQLSRPRGRPPARHRRGRSPPHLPTRDHADGATLGRRDANASGRPRRPVLRAWSGTTAAPVVAPPFSWAMEPTRIGTPPSPTGRRRYKHRIALCSATVSWAIEPTRIGTPSETLCLLQQP